MTRKELIEWWQLIKNRPNLQNYEETRLFQLNHRVMEASHEIHNNNMLKKEK